MKKSIALLFLLVGIQGFSQGKNELLEHYRAYYDEMRLQGDVNGVIGALTHINILEPSQARKDTLAFVYMNNGQHMQALNTIGIEKNATDSDLAIQVKAVSLKSLGQPKRAIEQFEVLFSREPTPYVAYELADLKIQTGDSKGAMAHIDYGIANATEEMKYAFYERQQPYEVPLKAAFHHLKGLANFNGDKASIDVAIVSFDEALKIAPNFNLASLSKQALESRKNELPEGKEN